MTLTQIVVGKGYTNCIPWRMLAIFPSIDGVGYLTCKNVIGWSLVSRISILIFVKIVC